MSRQTVSVPNEVRKTRGGGVSWRKRGVVRWDVKTHHFGEYRQS